LKKYEKEVVRDDPHLKYAVEGTTALITLNRPGVKNAFSLEMLTLWRQALEQARDNERVRVVILTGQGNAFCAGGDLQDMDRGKFRGWDMKRFLWETVYPVAFIMESLDKPVIAAVNGAAAGAGLDMALMCDFRICSNRAKFSASFINLGLVAGDGGAYFLPRLIGLSQALEMLLTGDLVSAEEAYRIGLVNRVVPKERLMAEARGLAEKLASKPPQAVRMMKRSVYQGLNSSLRGHLDFVSSQLGLLTQTHDHQEAVRAFLEKRKPVFRGE